MNRITPDKSGLVFHLESLTRSECDGSQPALAFLASATQIYNSHALCDQLGLPLDTPVERLLLSGWQKWSVDLPDRLRGAFAFAIHDPSAGLLFLARDFVGLAPLYYSVRENVIAVAQTSKLLRSIVSDPFASDIHRLANFLDNMHRTRTHTFFKDLQRLPAGHTLSFKAGETGTIDRYWSPDTARRPVSNNDAAEQFRDLFDRAVARSFRYGSTALQLSGGLDSSAILGSVVGSGVSPQDLPCMVMTYHDTDQWNDQPYLAAIQAKWGMTFDEIPSDLHNPLSDMSQLLDILDGPYFSYGRSVSSSLMKKAKSLGWTNLLSGHGGDEVVAYGAGRLNELALERRWIALWREVRGYSNLYGYSQARLMLGYLMHIAWLRRVRRKLFPSSFVQSSPGEQSLSEAARSEFGAERPVEETVLTRPDHNDFMVHAAMLEHPVQQLALETIGQCSRAVGVETQMPFYDQELVEFSLSLPSHWRLRDGMTRFVLREAMRDSLPQAILARQSKYDFTAPFTAGLLANKASVLDWTGTKAGLLTELVNAERLNTLRDNLHRADSELSDQDAKFLWRCAVLRIWEHEMDPKPASPNLIPLSKVA